MGTLKRIVLLGAFVGSAGMVGLALGGPFTDRGTQPGVLFPLESSTDCRSCHGYDYDPQHAIEPGDTWAGTPMAQAGRDPLFWAALDVANHDVPGIGEFCLRCHTPGAWLAGRVQPTAGSADGCGLQGAIDDPYANDFDGVTCHLCHRMMVNPAPPVGEQPFYLENAQFWIDDAAMCGNDFGPCRRGPYAYPVPEVPPPHGFAYSPYHQSSDLCGTCHNVTHPARNLIVGGVDQGIRFPIERTYREWEQSDFAVAGPGQRTCQSCHMPESGISPAYPCVFQDNDRTGQLAVHRFMGGNSWLPDVIRQAYPNLGTPDDLMLARDHALDMLQNESADLEITVPPQVSSASTLPVTVKVTNRTGHKLPTGYSEGRRMWLHVVAKDGTGATFWESGAYDPVTAVLASDPALKVYRADHGIWNRNGTAACDTAEPSGSPIFHFALNDCIALDNRIPPPGFRGGADLATRPVGYVYPETSRGSGVLVHHDLTQYSIPVPLLAPSPVTVTATLRYQTASKEYVEFLRDEAVENQFPDDCIPRVSGAADKSRGELLHGMWTAYGKSAPVDMETVSGVVTVISSATPGEASRTVPMRVTGYDRGTGNVTISYAPACGSTDHTVYVGSLSSMASMTFSAQECHRGTSGTATFPLGGGSFFWLIVGNDGATEGSYGRNGSGVERPEDTTLAGCKLPQDLALRCDP